MISFWTIFGLAVLAAFVLAYGSIVVLSIFSPDESTHQWDWLKPQEEKNP